MNVCRKCNHTIHERAKQCVICRAVYGAHCKAESLGVADTLTSAEVWTRYREQDARCYWCNEHLPFGAFSIDHLTPFSQGGENTFENIAAVCWTCNIRKGGRNANQYQRALQRQVGR